MTVSRKTSTRERASLTASSLVGWMSAMISFIESVSSVVALAPAREYQSRAPAHGWSVYHFLILWKNCDRRQHGDDQKKNSNARKAMMNTRSTFLKPTNPP